MFRLFYLFFPLRLPGVVAPHSVVPWGLSFSHRTDVFSIERFNRWVTALIFSQTSPWRLQWSEWTLDTPLITLDAPLITLDTPLTALAFVFASEFKLRRHGSCSGRVTFSSIPSKAKIKKHDNKLRRVSSDLKLMKTEFVRESLALWGKEKK